MEITYFRTFNWSSKIKCCKSFSPHKLVVINSGAWKYRLCYVKEKLTIYNTLAVLYSIVSHTKVCVISTLVITANISLQQALMTCCSRPRWAWKEMI